MEKELLFENMNLSKILKKGKYKKVDKFNKYLIWIIIILFVVDAILTFKNVHYHLQNNPSSIYQNIVVMIT